MMRKEDRIREAEASIKFIFIQNRTSMPLVLRVTRDERVHESARVEDIRVANSGMALNVHHIDKIEILSNE